MKEAKGKKRNSRRFSSSVVQLKNPLKGFGLAAISSYSLFNGNYEQALTKTIPINQRK